MIRFVRLEIKKEVRGKSTCRSLLFFVFRSMGDIDLRDESPHEAEAQLSKTIKEGLMRSVRKYRRFVVLHGDESCAWGPKRGVGAVGYLQATSGSLSLSLVEMSDCWGQRKTGNIDVRSAGACEQYHWCNTLEWACMNWLLGP
jgi:hypothetical protein